MKNSLHLEINNLMSDSVNPTNVPGFFLLFILILVYPLTDNNFSIIPSKSKSSFIDPILIIFYLLNKSYYK